MLIFADYIGFKTRIPFGDFELKGKIGFIHIEPSDLHVYF